jgi:capsid protein
MKKKPSKAISRPKSPVKAKGTLPAKTTGNDKLPKKQAFVRGGYGLYRGADYQSRQRAPLIPLPRDAKYDCSSFSQLRLMALGRFMDSNVSWIRGLVNEICNNVVGAGWTPVFEGKNQNWGHQAETWLVNWHKVCDVRGQQMKTVMWQALRGTIVDGDQLSILTETNTHYPQVQQIPAHRISTRSYQSTEQFGGDANAQMQNGVKTDKLGRPVGYLVTGDDPEGNEDEFVAAQNAHLIAGQEWVAQGRGVTAMASFLNEAVDIDDLSELLKFAAKILASIALIENVEGDDEGDDEEFLNETSLQNGKEMAIEEIYGGMIRKFRAGSGGKLEAFEHQQPSTNIQEWRRELMRGCYAAMGWPIELALDFKGLTGSNTRAILEKAQKTVEYWQTILGYWYYRVTCYAIAKAMKLGLLPWNPEWYKWDFQLPKKMTVDAGRDSQQDRANVAAGLTTLSAVFGKNGLRWKPETDQWLDEVEYLVEGINKRPALKELTVQYILSQRFVNTFSGKPAAPEKPAEDPETDPETPAEDKTDKTEE